MLETILLGIVQGITEFLPVSSSAHLSILPELLGWEEHSNLLDLVFHGGTLLAVIISFRKKLIPLILTPRKNKALLQNLIIATIPAVLIGFAAIQIMDTLDSNYLTISMLVIVGLMLIAIDLPMFNRPTTTNSIEQISTKQAISIGIAQSVAYIRGTSRSGITIIAGKTSKLDTQTAINFSFLLSIPIIALGFLYGVFEIIKGEPTQTISLSEFILAFTSSFISGIIAIHILLTLTKKIGFKWFGIYRIILALILIIRLL